MLMFAPIGLLMRHTAIGYFIASSSAGLEIACIDATMLAKRCHVPTILAIRGRVQNRSVQNIEKNEGFRQNFEIVVAISGDERALCLEKPLAIWPD